MNYLQKDFVMKHWKSKYNYTLLIIIIAWIIISVIFPRLSWSLIKLNTFTAFQYGTTEFSIFLSGWITLNYLIACLLVGVVGGYLLGMAMSYFRFVNIILYYPLSAFKSIPVTILISVFISIFGFENYVIPLLSLPIISILSINITDSWKQINSNRNETINLLGLNRRHVFAHIHFWETLEVFFSTFKIIFSYLIALIIAFDYFLENMEGLGSYIRRSDSENKTLMYLAVFIVGAASSIILHYSYLLEKRMIKWKTKI